MLTITTLLIALGLCATGCSLIATFSGEHLVRPLVALLVSVAILASGAAFAINGTRNHAEMLVDYGNSGMFSEHRRLIEADGFDLNVVYEVDGTRYRCKAYKNSDHEWDIPKACQKLAHSGRGEY